jgi:hypothetical protein
MALHGTLFRGAQLAILKCREQLFQFAALNGSTRGHQADAMQFTEVQTRPVYELAGVVVITFESRGNLTIGKAVNLTHNERLTVLRWHEDQGRLHRLTSLPALNMPFRWSLRGWRASHFQWLLYIYKTLPLPQVVDGQVARYPENPGLEIPGRTKLTDTFMGADKCILSDVLGCLLIPNRAIDIVKDRLMQLMEKLSECFSITCLRSANQGHVKSLRWF